MILRTSRNILSDCRSAPWLILIWLPAVAVFLLTTALSLNLLVELTRNQPVSSLLPVSYIRATGEPAMNGLLWSQTFFGHFLAIAYVAAKHRGTPRFRAHCMYAAALYLFPLGLVFSTLFFNVLQSTAQHVSLHDIDDVMSLGARVALALYAVTCAIFAVVLVALWPLARHLSLPWAVLCAFCIAITLLWGHEFLRIPRETFILVAWAVHPIALAYLIRAMEADALAPITASRVPDPEGAP